MPTSPVLSQLLVSTSSAVENASKHTLVCVFLRGGADTLNLVVPFADDHYYNTRPSLAVKAPGLDPDCAIKLDEHYAFHPAMKPLEAAFKDGRLGLLQGVGTDSTSGSHFECQDQMEHGDSEKARPAGGGWLGRFLRSRVAQSTSPLSAVAIGTKLPESLRGAPSVSVLEHLDDVAIKAPSGDPAAVMGALRAMYGADVSLLGQRGQQTLDLFNRMTALRNQLYLPANDADYPKHGFGEGLRELARLIKAGVGLEVACININGWDSHFFQGTTVGGFAANAKVLAEGLAAFETDLKALRSRYTVIVMTEFGRRIYENASLGTDHGRGFTFMALGDKVNGGRILGGWPIGAMDETNPLGPGGVDIKHDFRDVFAEVLRGAMGEVDAAKIFPGAGLASVGLMG